eukprot:scaffold1235_cov358-Prasinococcus_capsulatus_cf.AAC.3
MDAPSHCMLGSKDAYVLRAQRLLRRVVQAGGVDAALPRESPHPHTSTASNPCARYLLPPRYRSRVLGAPAHGPALGRSRTAGRLCGGGALRRDQIRIGES